MDIQKMTIAQNIGTDKSYGAEMLEDFISGKGELLEHLF